MRGYPGMTAMFLVFASICNVQAQRPPSQESVSDEARFPIARGDNFTFQPAAGSLCHWAVAQYPLSGKEFFVLDSQPACAPPAGNASTTLRLRFGDEVAPGNATLTVQCKEPSVWKFIINDDEPEREGKTVIDSVCDTGDLPSDKDGLAGGWRNGSNTRSQTGSIGPGGPSWGPSLPGHRGNWSHDLPTTLSAPLSGFPNGLSQGSNPASNPASNTSNTLTGGGPSGTDIDMADTGVGFPTALNQGRTSLHNGDTGSLPTTGASNPAFGSDNDLPSGQVPRESFGAAPLTTDPLLTAQSTASNSDGVADGDTSPSATKQPSEPTVESITSITSSGLEGLQASTTGTLPTSCVCTC